MDAQKSRIEMFFINYLNKNALSRDSAVCAREIKDAMYKQRDHFIEQGYASSVLQGLFNKGLLRSYKTSHVKSTAYYWVKHD